MSKRRGTAERQPARKLDRTLLVSPEKLLGTLDPAGGGAYDIRTSRFLEVWALVGLATLARRQLARPASVAVDGPGDAARFARAVGFDEAVAGQPPKHPGERGRTVTLRRFSGYRGIEPTAHEIAKLVLPEVEDDASRRVLQYVIVELLRNVVQHSRDPLGGVVAAQRMGERQHYATPCVQVAVADTGVGILATMQGLHPELRDASAALDKAIQPHISGKFEEGLTGDGVNAGMGLFFIHEMARLSTGRLLLASRGAARMVEGNPQDVDRPVPRMLKPPGTGFPGTLVAFELPLGRILDYDGLIATIQEQARKRTPKRALHRWIRYDRTPPRARPFRVSRVAENTAAAERFSANTLVPRLLQRKPFVLDFTGIEVCTQSFLHALLFRAIRLAWAEHVEIDVLHACPAVRSGIETLEEYALGG